MNHLSFSEERKLKRGSEGGVGSIGWSGLQATRGRGDQGIELELVVIELARWCYFFFWEPIYKGQVELARILAGAEGPLPMILCCWSRMFAGKAAEKCAHVLLYSNSTCSQPGARQKDSRVSL